MYIFVIIAFTGILLMIGVLGALVYLLYLPFKKKLLKSGKLTKENSKAINRIYMIGILLLTIYQTYTAFYPSKSFYEEEFKSVTCRTIPRSANFIRKAASYPDFHGKYASSSQINLSNQDYQQLLQELDTDKRFTPNGQLITSDEFNEVLGEKDKNKIVHCFHKKNG